MRWSPARASRPIGTMNERTDAQSSSPAIAAWWARRSCGALRARGLRAICCCATRRELDLTRPGRGRATSFERSARSTCSWRPRRSAASTPTTRYPADFIRDNLAIQTNVIDAAYRNGTRKLLFLGSSCIYPKLAPQPMTEECLLTGPLEPTNEWYAIAKIAGIKMCQAYRRQYGFNAISPDADQSLRARATTSTCRTRTCCRR